MSDSLRQSCANVLLPAAAVVFTMVASVPGTVCAQQATADSDVSAQAQVAWGQSPNVYTAPASNAEAHAPTVEIPQQAGAWGAPNTYTSNSSSEQSQGRQRASGRAQRQTASVSTYTPNTYVHSAVDAGRSVNSSALHGGQTRKPRAGVGTLLKKVLPGRPDRASVQTVSNIRPSTYNGSSQSGVASWYGKAWHGKKTANGERYDMHSLTAAHRSLPFGTLVKVQNMSNGREVIVRINNRGPFSKGRVLDCSRAAAEKLGFIGKGVTKIKMQVVGRS